MNKLMEIIASAKSIWVSLMALSAHGNAMRAEELKRSELETRLLANRANVEDMKLMLKLGFTKEQIRDLLMSQRSLPKKLP